MSDLFNRLETNSRNKMATSDQIKILIEAHTAPLVASIEELTRSLGALTNSNTVGEFEEEKINVTIRCDEPLDVIKSLPTFDGKNSYVSWREAATNSMKIYAKGSKRYFSALTILRNKIVNDANDTLTNHGTVLNFDAIISRLDFAYADKRPLHIIEQELSIMRQGSQSIMTYYNEVNKKLTDLTNKTIMSYGTGSNITKELNNRNRQYALRVFMTGLNAPLADILFSISPNSLPDALAKAQELEANRVRANFALHFNKPMINNYINRGNNILRFPNRNNRDYRPNENANRLLNTKPEPMELGSSNFKFRQERQQNFKNNFQQNRTFNNFHNTRPFNNYQNGLKRQSDNSGQISHQPHQKFQRVNNLNEGSFLDQGTDCPTLLRQPPQEENIKF